jgi:hypothetical protein
MRVNLKKNIEKEMKKGVFFYNKNDLDNAFNHFERAHILGQSYIIAHTKSHFWMFKIGFKRKKIKEMIGQLLRMVASILFSKFWVPRGNTGGTNVNPFKKMDLPEDLKEILEGR